MKKNDIFYYPGFTRKAVSFTIDDGNVETDRKFIEIVKPYGITGTFNLCSHNLSAFSPEGYREFYGGFEISNHCKYHPYALKDGKKYEISDQPFNPADADKSRIYKSGIEGLYHFHAPQGWRMAADGKSYIKFAEESRYELENVFGPGSVKGFVWPYCRQSNSEVFSALKNAGYYGIRTTGETGDGTGFDIPADRMNWSYNAANTSLLRVMDLYEKYPDDGKLKFFCFGVHSVDFERSGNWDELGLFARKYGGRPREYWYASVREVFEYHDAVNAVEVTDSGIKNNSSTELYIKINNKEVILHPYSELFV